MSLLKSSIISIISLLFLINCYSQTSSPTIVRGLVTDSSSNEPLPSVYIMYVNSTIAATTDDEGVFSFQTQDTTSYLKIMFVGHRTRIVHLRPGENQFIHIIMAPLSEQLSEVVIKGKRKRKHYRNNDNPAVAIIEEVIHHKSQNKAENFDYLENIKYQKILLSLDHVSPKLEKIGLMKPFRFVLNNSDTTIFPGKKVLPVYLQEDFVTDYYRKQPPAKKEITSAEKLVSFEEYIDSKTITASINYLYHDIDIYNNNTELLGNQFLSPIATIAPSFYKYFINDTIVVDSTKCIRLTFAPRNKNDFLFQGYIYITFDSAFAVKKITMQVNKEINLNWVKSLEFDQEFRKIDQGWILSRNEMNIDFGITKNSMGLYGQRIVAYSNYTVNVPLNDSVFKKTPTITKGSLAKNEIFWRQSRPVELRKSEQNVYIFMDSLQNLQAFRRDVDFIRLLTIGFKQIGPIEIGPITSIYSQNPIEGSRIRLGARTTRKFNNKLYFEAYGAYGFTDQQFKSYANAVYSLNDKSVREFPLKTVGVSFQNDMKIPGEDLQYISTDNILLSFKRGVNDKMYFNKSYQIQYLNEFPSHFSYGLTYNYTRMTPAGNLFFTTNNYTNDINYVNHINVGKIALDLRYAPHEKIVQGSIYRIVLTSKYPIVELKYSAGARFLGSDYNFQNIQGSISKRFNLSLLGYSDLELEGGKVFGHVPFPLLDIHRANQTYAYQPLSYNLMNFMEFVSDQYAALNVDHNFNGLFFNRIPLIKKLKFRESLTFKMLMGNLSNINNPAYHQDLFKFSTDPSGNPLTFSLGKQPYIEAGFGITNIFKFFRIDYIMRLTYLDHPRISKSGIRFDYKFDF